MPKIPGMQKFSSNSKLSRSPKIGEHRQIMQELGLIKTNIILSKKYYRITIKMSWKKN